MSVDKELVVKYQEQLRDSSVEELLGWAVENMSVEKLAFASSLGAEDQVLTHIIATKFPQIGIFTIDTGRLPQETYDLIQKTKNKYRFNYEILFPEREGLEKLISERGPNLFYLGIEERKACCRMRKIEPLQRKLQKLDAWICGLRKEQSVTRTDINIIEWDEANDLIKLNPLVDWTEKQVWEYIKSNCIPYSELHDRGYPSIGCAPCTRAIIEGEDVRAGRWWWEDASHKECGLHRK